MPKAAPWRAKIWVSGNLGQLWLRLFCYTWTYHHSPSDRSQRPKARTSQDGQIAHGHYVERKRYTSWVLKVVLLSTLRKIRSYYHGPILVILTLVRISPASWIQGT